MPALNKIKDHIAPEEKVNICHISNVDLYFLFMKIFKGSINI